MTPPFVPPVKSADDNCMFDKYPESNDISSSSVLVSAKEQEDFAGF